MAETQKVAVPKCSPTPRDEVARKQAAFLENMKRVSTEFGLVLV